MNARELRKIHTEPLEQHVSIGLDAIAASPTLCGYFQDLWLHDSNSAEHTMRVTIGMIDAVNELFNGAMTEEELNQMIELAALCGISHDLGKRDVSGRLLRRKKVTIQHIEAIRKPHMEHLREKIQKIPAHELSEELKEQILAVVMSHHEFLGNSNGRGPYPRSSVDGDTHLRVRKTPPPMIRTLQAILAFADTSDRITHGFHNTVTVERADAHGMMNLILGEAKYPLSDIEKVIIAPAVTDAVMDVSESVVTTCFTRLGIVT